MNRIRLALVLIVVVILSACGQYGDLYAPPSETEIQDQVDDQAVGELQEEKLQQTKEDTAE